MTYLSGPARGKWADYRASALPVCPPQLSTARHARNCGDISPASPSSSLLTCITIRGRCARGDRAPTDARGETLPCRCARGERGPDRARGEMRPCRCERSGEHGIDVSRGRGKAIGEERRASR